MLLYYIMSTYPPPTSNTPIFDPARFLTIDEALIEELRLVLPNLSAVAPNNNNPFVFAINNTLNVKNADTSPTGSISIDADNSATDFGMYWASGGVKPFVMTTLDATALQVKDTTLALYDSTGTPNTTNLTADSVEIVGGLTKTWADILAGGGGSVGTLNQVLSNGNSATGTYATIALTDTDVGGQANPILMLNNTNATGSVAMEVYKNKPTAVVAGDVLFNQSVYGKDSLLNKQEYTRITHTIRDGAGGVEDGSIEFGCFVNGSFNNFLQINGNQNEVNCLKPLDMGNNSILTTTGDIPITATASSGTGHIDITSKTGAVVNVAANININASASTGTGNINLIPKVSTGAILTDSNITTLSTTGGNKIDFVGGNPDSLFDINKDKVRLYWNDASAETATILIDNMYDTTSNIAMTFTTTTGDITTKIDNIATSQSVFLNDTRTGNVKSIKLDNNTSSSENRMDLIQNSGGGIVAQSVIVNTAGTQMLSLSHTDNAIAKALSLRQDTSGTGKLQYDNTIDSSAFEISSNNTDLTLISVSNCNINATALNFNGVNIIPRRTYNTFAFSVSGSPSGTILNFGSLADMVANTTWKVDVAFYTGDGINTSNVLTYVVEDTTAVYRETNSVFGYTQGGLQTCIQYDPTAMPMGTYCSFTDTFEVSNFAVGACSFKLTGGTSNGSFWSGTCRVSIVLTRLS